MSIVDPSSYLGLNGWVVQYDMDGTPFLERCVQPASATPPQADSSSFPTTERDLLKALLEVGYLPRDSRALTTRMRGIRNGIITPVSTPQTPVKSEFVDTVRQDPVQATRELFGEHFDSQVLQDHGYRVHSTQDLRSISHLPMLQSTEVSIQAQAANFSFNTTQPLSWDRISNHEPFDIGNAFHLDNLMITPTELLAEERNSKPPSSSNLWTNYLTLCGGRTPTDTAV